jgi:YesN/AraC family two-component response regulator
MSNILIIDDEKAIRKTLGEILSYEGYKIEEAMDGEEGLKKFREKSYDVVLCDIKMPKDRRNGIPGESQGIKSRYSDYYDFLAWYY